MLKNFSHAQFESTLKEIIERPFAKLPVHKDLLRLSSGFRIIDKDSGTNRLFVLKLIYVKR